MRIRIEQDAGDTLFWRGKRLVAGIHWRIKPRRYTYTATVYGRAPNDPPYFERDYTREAWAVKAILRELERRG